MFDAQLFQFGMTGIFVAYLIYDKQILMKEVIDSIKTNTMVTQALKETIDKKKEC
jgi:hypothetical protein